MLNCHYTSAFQGLSFFEQKNAHLLSRSLREELKIPESCREYRLGYLFLSILIFARFQAKPDTLKWVSNYEKTRWFLVLHVAKPAEDSLNRLLKLFNDALAKFNQPTLYTNSHQGSKQSQVDFSDYFHISIAWSLSEPTESDNEFIRNIDIQQVRQLSVNFNCIKAKVGNNVTSMPLPEPA